MYSGALKESWIVKRHNIPKYLKIISRLSCKISILTSFIFDPNIESGKAGEISRVCYGSQVFRGLYKSFKALMKRMLKKNNNNKEKYQPMREEIHRIEALGLTVRYCLWAM